MTVSVSLTPTKAFTQNKIGRQAGNNVESDNDNVHHKGLSQSDWTIVPQCEARTEC